MQRPRNPLLAFLFIYRSTGAALADLSFFARRNYYRARLILVGDVLLLAAAVDGKRYAKAPGDSGGSRPRSANVE